ncbi:MAG: integration host factor subunit beta [Candidatus Tokpelaia sp. JSC085]|nr:MAG: integration host factor subunit beta [Candidatus Tokpelaia sp. JSC085]
MIKSELVQIIVNHNPHLFQQDVEKTVVFDERSNALVEGKRVELRGFFAFSIKNRPARLARNTRKNTPVPVGDTWIPFFKRKLYTRLNSRTI